MKKLKRSIRGYDPAVVRQIVAELQENHRIRMEELKEQKRLLDEEHGHLAIEIDRLSEEGRRKPALLSEQAVARRLLEAHSEITETVWQALQELKKHEEEIQAEAIDKQLERDRMLEQVERRLKGALIQIEEGGK